MIDKDWKYGIALRSRVESQNHKRIFEIEGLAESLGLEKPISCIVEYNEDYDFRDNDALPGGQNNPLNICAYFTDSEFAYLEDFVRKQKFSSAQVITELVGKSLAAWAKARRIKLSKGQYSPWPIVRFYKMDGKNKCILTFNPNEGEDGFYVEEINTEEA